MVQAGQQRSVGRRDSFAYSTPAGRARPCTSTHLHSSPRHRAAHPLGAGGVRGRQG